MEEKSKNNGPETQGQFSRRNFLKTGAFLGTAMCISPALANVLPGERQQAAGSAISVLPEIYKSTNKPPSVQAKAHSPSLPSASAVWV